MKSLVYFLRYLNAAAIPADHFSSTKLQSYVWMADYFRGDAEGLTPVCVASLTGKAAVSQAIYDPLH